MKKKIIGIILTIIILTVITTLLVTPYVQHIFIPSHIGINFTVGSIHSTITITDRGKTILSEYHAGVLTQMGMNFTLAKLTGNSTFYNMTTFNMNLTYVSIGNQGSLTSSSTVLPGEWNRTSALLHDATYNSFNLTAIIRPDTGPYTAIPSGSTINSVTVKVNIRSGLTAAKATFRIALKKSGSATVYGSSIQPPLSYTVYSQVFAGIALSDLNALQIGIEITSKWYGVWDTFIPGLCTQVWVVIDYTEAQQGTNLTLNGSITATFSVLSQKTASFTKNPSITETFNLQHLKSVNFLRASTITLTIGIGGLFSYWTLTSLNLFGLIPITFSTFHIPTYTLTIKKDIVVSFTLSSDYSFPFNVPSTITFTLSPASNLVETFIHSWIRTAPILYVAIGIAIIILCLGLGMEKKKRHV